MRHFLAVLGVTLGAAVATAAGRLDERPDAYGGSSAARFLEPATAAASEARFRIVGRTSDAKHPEFGWSGVSIEARFRGTSVVAELDTGRDAYFQVVVDGETRGRIGGLGGRRKFTLAADLPDAVHDVRLWRLTESNAGRPSTFFGLHVPGGMLLRPPRRSHALEVIGDSITCGYGAEDEYPCRFRYTTENNYAAYASVAARALDADLYTECWSGKGILRNSDGSTDQPMPTVFQRAVPQDSSSNWDFSFIPEAVLVNLGTAEFRKGDPGRPFVDAYERFVFDLRARYPKAFIFLAIGPLLSGPELDRARAYLDKVVRSRQMRGDERIRQIHVPAQEPRNGLGCDRNPTLETHRLMGAFVASEMRRTLGW